MSIDYAKLNITDLDKLKSTPGGGAIVISPPIDKDMGKGGSIFTKIGVTLGQGAPKPGTDAGAKETLSKAKTSRGEADDARGGCEGYSITAKEDIGTAKLLGGEMGTKSKMALGTIATNVKVVTDLMNSIDNIDEEINALEEELETLTGGDNTGEGKTSAFSLTLGATPRGMARGAGKSPVGGEEPPAEDKPPVESEEEAPNDKERINEINAEIKTKTATSTAHVATVKATNLSTKSTKTNINQLYTRAMGEINTSKSISEQNQGSTNIASTIGQATTTIGGTAVSLGTLLTTSLFGAPIGAPLITYGGYATAAGGLLTGVAAATKGDIMGALDALNGAASSITTNKKSVDAAGKEPKGAATPAATPQPATPQVIPKNPPDPDRYLA